MSPESEQVARYGNYARFGGAIAALGLVAACQGTSVSNSEHSLPSSDIKPTPSSFASNSQSSVMPSPSGEAKTTSGYENCDSFRSVQPGYYFNNRYRPHIQDQLELLHVAYSSGSNVDIDRDATTYVQMLHAMENDPEYAEAMERTNNIISRNPSQRISADQFLQLKVSIPAECAPHRITNMDSQKELQRTASVADELGNALLRHLQDQGSRAWRWFRNIMANELSKIEDSN